MKSNPPLAPKLSVYCTCTVAMDACGWVEALLLLLPPFFFFCVDYFIFFLWVGCSEVRKNPPRMKSNERTRRTGGMERRHRTHGERGYGGSFKKLFSESSIALTLAVRRRKGIIDAAAAQLSPCVIDGLIFFFLIFKK